MSPDLCLSMLITPLVVGLLAGLVPSGWAATYTSGVVEPFIRRAGDYDFQQVTGEYYLASWKMTPSVYREPDVRRLTPWRMALR